MNTSDKLVLLVVILILALVGIIYEWATGAWTTRRPSPDTTAPDERPAGDD